MPTDSTDHLIDRALAVERAFVAALGGYTLQIAGAHLLTHERLPTAPFNVVIGADVAEARLTGFFERTLDHYFQRALRPTFRLRAPVGPPIAAGLLRFGFVRSPRPTWLVVAPRSGELHRTATAAWRSVAAEDVRDAAPALLPGADRLEASRAFEVAIATPHPGERWSAWARTGSQPAAGLAIVYQRDRIAWITRFGPAVETSPALDPGFAAIGGDEAEWIATLTLEAPAPAPADGRAVVAEFTTFELPRDAALELPRPGPPGPPRWRPPRSPVGRG